jgi:hypothetical protein
MASNVDQLMTMMNKINRRMKVMPLLNFALVKKLGSNLARYMLHPLVKKGSCAQRRIPRATSRHALTLAQHLTNRHPLLRR